MSSTETNVVAKANKKWSWSKEARARHSERMKALHAERQRKTPDLRGRPATKNITLDAELQDRLNGVADKLHTEFGFRPTLSQTVLYVLNKAEV